MKRNELKNITTEMVTSYLTDGWTLEWSNTSYGGCKAAWKLSRENELRWVVVKEAGGYGSTLPSITMLEIEGEQGSDFFREENAISHETFFEIAEDWFTHDEDEAEAVFEKQAERYQSNWKTTVHELKTTDGIVAYFRTRPGFEKATKKNLRIKKTESAVAFSNWHREFYEVTLLNRLGNPKLTKTYALS